MAASNKSVGLQITMAVFAMLAVIGWVAFYMQFKELRENKDVYAEATKDLATEVNTTRAQDDKIQALKVVIGHNHPEVGDDQQGATDTVIGAANLDLARVAGSPSNLATAITNIQNAYTSEQATSKGLAVNLADANAAVARLRGEYQIQVASHKKRADDAVSEKDQAEKDFAEQLSQRDQTITEQRRLLNEQIVKFDNAKIAWDSERKVMSGKLVQLEEQVDLLREKLKNVTRVSFERPDGLVRWVDNTAGLVWLNLGSDDGLRVRTTFSVYRKGHHGVARGAEDIKAQIEVTRIMSGHSAEARILDEDIYDPIGKGDPVYTPLWSPGRVEKFSIAGLIDLDQDGIMDRTRFHEIVADAGALLGHEIRDDGSRVRFTQFPNEWVDWSEGDAELDSDTKYLIIASIPDPTLALRDEDKEKRALIGAQLKRMRDEARRLGIEEINLNDFLAYIGYIPRRNLYIPGVVDRPYNLRQGAASVSTNEVVKNRAAAGQVSGLYGRSKRLKPQSSAGQTSKLYSK
jgi:hypothetical protein